MIELRPTGEADLDFVLAAEADPEADRWIMADPRSVHADALTDDDIEHLLIVSGDEPVGFVLLAGLLNGDAALEVRRIVVVRRGEGLGRAALALVLARCFEVHEARRVWLDVSPGNERGKRAYRAAGFVYEGTLRDAVRVAPDVWEPLDVMSVLRADWAATV